MRQYVSLDDVIETAEKYFILSSPIRLKILQLSQHPIKIRELTKKFNLAATTLTGHIKLLHQAKLITKERNKDNSVTIKATVQIDNKGKIKF